MSERFTGGLNVSSKPMISVVMSVFNGEPAQFDEIPNFIDQLLSEPRGALNESPVDMSKYNLLKQALTLK